ncbi:hypothetical protein N9452_09725 [Alphaproteobacteria bacterium]|nr:hypothetical protein [Alphaproteobacteria bacterium]
MEEAPAEPGNAAPSPLIAAYGEVQAIIGEARPACNRVAYKAAMPNGSHYHL